MKRFAVFLILCSLLTAFCAMAETQYSSILSDLSTEDLEGLKKDIGVEIMLHHEVSSDEEKIILPVVKREAETYYSNLGLAIDWAWYGWEYDYTQQWDFFTLKTHLDCKIADDKSEKREVYAELFPTSGVMTVLYLQTGDLVIIDRRNELPQVLLADNSQRTINTRTGIDLSTMDTDALSELKSAIEAEIDLNHKVDGSVQSKVSELVKTVVEAHFALADIKVSWPWFDYSYTHDWGCYTETTRIGFKDGNGKKQDLPVYCEAYFENGEYSLYYLTIGEQVLFDNRDKLTDPACITFLSSRVYPIAAEHAESGNYNEALRLWRSIGNYSDSSSQADACQRILDEQSYNDAKALMQKGDYDEAIAVFTALNGYSDSTEQIAACKLAIQEIEYSSAKALMDNQQYESAIQSFEALGGYAESEQLIAACETAINERALASAKSLMDSQEYEAAIAAFDALQGYGDSKEMLGRCHDAINERGYNKAMQLKAKYRFEEGAAAFKALSGYSDSDAQLAECQLALSTIDRSIDIRQTELNVYVKQKAVLEPIVNTLNSSAPAKTALAFSSSDEKVAKVDKKGIITGIAFGDVNISCFAEDNPNVGAVVPVHVVLPVEKVTLSTVKLNLMISASSQLVGQGTLSVSIEPQNAFVQTVTWTSSNEKVATVDTDGVIHAVSIGKATITAQSNDASGTAKKATCAVTVTQAVESLTLDATEGMAYVGKSSTLKATPLPKDAADKKVTWSSSNEAIITVSSSGKVTGVAPGNAIITATAASGVTAQYNATVKYAPTVMKVSARATLIAKNSVGNSWSKEFLIDDKEFPKSTKITVEDGQIVKVECWITENDKNPETGGFSEEFVFTGNELKKGLTIARTVYVTENGGRYSGNSAEWEVVITFKP